ncbi:MAG: diaminopimelate epimerase [Lachnospiraceae bacterium]|nr:diaminopimelate epimerase [Lachnospiraceae bacterium]
MQIEFTKMHGCGNDYVYIDGSRFHIDSFSKPQFVRSVSDRHFGIGSDGVIFINPSDIADFEMEMYNADGSRSEMCGNGIRCVAKYVYDKGLWDEDEVDIESFGKVKHIILFIKDDEVKTARVDMGEPILNPVMIPVNTSMLDDPTGNVIMKPILAGGKEYKITCVSMGNPHGIIYVDDVDNLEIEKVGPILENDPFFPKRANIEFVQNLDKTHVKMRVWERGTGETMACGTGCSALTVAGVLNGFYERNTDVNIEVLGGVIKVNYAKDGHVYMTGPAEISFEGVLEWQE